MIEIKKPISWKEVFYSGHRRLWSLWQCKATAEDSGYPFFEWNGRVYYTKTPNAELRLDNDTICLSSELEK